jgi:hypothetical protein
VCPKSLRERENALTSPSKSAKENKTKDIVAPIASGPSSPWGNSHLPAEMYLKTQLI